MASPYQRSMGVPQGVNIPEHLLPKRMFGTAAPQPHDDDSQQPPSPSSSFNQSVHRQNQYPPQPPAVSRLLSLAQHPHPQTQHPQTQHPQHPQQQHPQNTQQQQTQHPQHTQQYRRPPSQQGGYPNPSIAGHQQPAPLQQPPQDPPQGAPQGYRPGHANGSQKPQSNPNPNQPAMYQPYHPQLHPQAHKPPNAVSSGPSGPGYPNTPINANSNPVYSRNAKPHPYAQGKVSQVSSGPQPGPQGPGYLPYGQPQEPIQTRAPPAGPQHLLFPQPLNGSLYAARSGSALSLTHFPVNSPIQVQPLQFLPSHGSLQTAGNRASRGRAPSGNLAPIQTNQVLENPGRRIVSTGNMYSPIRSNVPTLDPSRTKSLSTASMQQQQFQQQQQQQQYQQQYQQQQYQQSQQSLASTGASPSSLHKRSSSGTSLLHTFSLSSKSRSFTSLSKISSSLSTKKYNSSTSLQNQNMHHMNHKLERDRIISTSTLTSFKTILQRKPSVYPAFLSRVARVFKESIILTINTKDGLEYHDTFTGKMAVDIICRIIRTNDRNLALLLGRSLDAQKFFRDVTYNHRLRDSVHEVYAFNHVYSDVELYNNDLVGNGAGGPGSAGNSKHGSFVDGQQLMQSQLQQKQEPSSTVATGVNGVFTILTDCYSPTCTRNKLCYSISCPRRLEQQARLNLKPQGGLKRAVSRLSLHDQEENKTLWHETVPQSILDKLDKVEKMRQELIYEFIYTERDYVKDLEFMTDFYIMPLRNPANNIIPEREREIFIRTVFGGVSDLLRLAKRMSELLTRRQQQQKPVVENLSDVFLEHVGDFEPFIKYSGNKVFASFEHERQLQVNMKYARFLDAIEKKPESRKQDLSSFLIKGIQRPARYQLLLNGIIKNTNAEHPDYKGLLKAKEEIEKVLVKINIQTGELTDRHKIMVLHRLLGKQTLEEKFNFKLSYSNRIIYQVTLSRKRDNEKIDLYLFEHAILLVKHKVQNKREQHKVFEKPILLPLLFVNTGYDFPNFNSILSNRLDGSIISDTGLKPNKTETLYTVGGSSTSTKLQLNLFGLGKNQVHTSLFADDITNQQQVIQQIFQQQKKLIEQNDIFSLSKFETRRFHGNNKINCAVPCYGGKKLLYGTDLGVWVSTVRSISTTSNEKICSDPTMVISNLYVTQIEVLVEYSKLLILSDKTLYEFDLSCTDSLDHVKNTRSGKEILKNIAFFKLGICDGRLLVCAAKKGISNGVYSINIFEPSNPFDSKSSKNRNKKYEIREFSFGSEPVSISFFKTKLCVGCTKGFEILSVEKGKKEPILDEADPSLDFATQRESVTPLTIHRLGYNFLVSYSEFSFLINKNGWRTSHDWGIFWEGSPQNIALFYPYILSFEQRFIEVRDLDSTNLLRSLAGENIRFLHSNEHEALFACEENGYDIIVSIDFLNLKPRQKGKVGEKKDGGNGKITPVV